MKPRLSFLLGVAVTRLGDRLRGRAVATNDILLTPSESSRGTVTMKVAPGCAIAFRNAAVMMSPYDDRSFDVVRLPTDVPRGILLNDEVGAFERSVPKCVALFGIYPGTLPAVASMPIPYSSFLICDPENPGVLRVLPTTPGTYYVVGISRFTVAAAGDPVSLIHCAPYRVTV